MLYFVRSDDLFGQPHIKHSYFPKGTPQHGSWAEEGIPAIAQYFVFFSLSDKHRHRVETYSASGAHSYLTVALDEDPDANQKFIGTLAYQYTRSAPRDIAPRNNVVVRLCSIECCVAHDFHCSANQSFLADLKEWSAISPHLYIWDYVVNFTHYLSPLPNFATLQPKIKTFQQHKAIGIMEQAAYQSRGGEFAELRSYLLSKILWNLDCNTEEVVNDFLAGYYGRAGVPVRRYFDLLQSLVKPDVHFAYGIQPSDEIYSADFIHRAENIFAEAESVADNVEILHRVELASLPVLYLKCMQAPASAKQDGTYDKFCRIAEREGITHYNEEGESYRKAFHQKIKMAVH